MARWLVPVVWLAAVGCAWTTPQLHVAATGAMAADCTSTAAQVGRPDRVELNPLLGPKPSVGEIVAWCGLAVTTTHAVADLLPVPWRRAWLTSVTVLELTVFLFNVTP